MKPIRFAVTHPVTIWMSAVAAVVFGLVSVGRLDMGLLPEVNYPSLTLQTEFPNTAPADVENLVTRPLEEAVGVVPGLRKVHSISQSGLSQITLEFDWGTAMDFAGLDVREKVDLVDLPQDAKAPVLLRYDPALDPVLRIGLWGDGPQTYLRALAEDVVKREIESVQGVAAARVIGGLEEEIQVRLDEARLAAHGLTIAAVTEALARENVSASGGRLRDRDAEYIVRTLSRFGTLGDIRNVTIGSDGGRAVRLSEVAEVVRAHKERTDITHVDGRESVEIAVYKEGDANIVDMARRVAERLGPLAKTLPAGVHQEVLFDQSVFIARAVAEVRNNALIGGLLAVLVLYLFLRDLRATSIIAVAIPLSIVATFILMQTQNVSLNVMSLGGLALGVGMLVDNSIVVLEAIQRRREQGGADLVETAVRGTDEVARAVTASTLTTVAVFVPIVFVVVGVAGQIFRDQALTVTFSLLVSLVVALTFTPMASALGTATTGRPAERWTRRWRPRHQAARWWRRIPQWAVHAVFLGAPLAVAAGARRLGRALRWLLVTGLTPLTWAFARTYPRLERTYERVLALALRQRAAVLGLVVAVAAAAVLLAPTLGSELVPTLAQGEFTLRLELPEGTPLSVTDGMTSRIERDLRAVPQIQRLATEVGISHEEGGQAARQKENRAEVQVRLLRSDRSTETAALAGIRRVLAGYPDVRMQVHRQALMSLASPVEVDVYGYDLDALQRLADQVVAQMEHTPGLRDIRPAMVPGSPEVRIAFDRDKLDRLGLDVAEVSRTVRAKVLGEVASRFRDQDRHIEIRVRNVDEQRTTLAAVQDIVVAERDGITIPLSSIASMSVARGPAEIHRLGNRRVAIVGASLAGRDLGSVSRDLQTRLARLPLPAGVSIALGGQNEELGQSYRSLRLAILLAVFLVYLVMASQFESLLYPFIIMVTVPLALAGAVFGLKLAGLAVSVIAVIGAIMLAGIVVNNGIVLVDRINQLRRAGAPLHAATLQAGQERLRPILMTSTTTVLGLLPMALGLGEGAELRAPLAVTVIGGLVLGTALTLVAVPVIYTLLTPERKPEVEKTPALAPAMRREEA